MFELGDLLLENTESTSQIINITAGTGDTVPLTFKGIRIGNFVILGCSATAGPISGGTPAYTVTATGLFTGRTTWAPKQTVWACAMVTTGGTNVLGSASITTAGALTIYNANAGTFTAASTFACNGFYWHYDLS